VNRPAAKPVLLSRIRHRLARPLARVAFSLVLIAMLVAGSVAAAMPMGSSAQPDAVVDAVPPCHGESPSQAPDARDHGCCDMACGCAVLHAAGDRPGAGRAGSTDSRDAGDARRIRAGFARGDSAPATSDPHACVTTACPCLARGRIRRLRPRSAGIQP